ncbi:MAG: Nif3-like dinuclear metal center hexameric protein [Clostridiales bacterium]|jgi:dinuclear metal center YbgI/SA1388 family protein|nr:Nif3-like dinuclear metal center hexameric protein [Clostridiales bacterium]
MPVICDDIIDMMEKLAPPSLAESWDNSGLLIGRRAAGVKKILVALDATAEVVREAVEIGADMIVTHHPVIFKPMAQINGDTPLGEKLLTLIEQKIAVYAAHTNLDIAQGGTNDTFAESIGLTAVEPLLQTENAVFAAIGRMGRLKTPMSLSAFAAEIKRKIGLPTIRFVGDGDRRIETAGLSTGSASNAKNFIEAQKRGCDVFITGDIRFHEAQDALALGLPLIDATHYASENLVADKISAYLRKELDALKKSGITVVRSHTDGQVFQNSI